MKTILLVEDTEALAKEMHDLLVMQNYNVVTAPNGVEALNLLDKVTPDLIITDLLMPQMDGFQFFSHLRSKPALKDIPAMIITAKAGNDIQSTANELGVEVVLKKPCRAATLLASVESLIK